MKSQVIRLDNAGQLINRGSPLGLQLINDPFNMEQAAQIAPQDPNALFRSTVAKLTTELANDFKRQFSRQIWDGNPGNTSGSAGGYIEFNGLNRIVNTGYQDVISQTACPASDSLVQDFEDAIIQNNVIHAVRTIVETYRDRKYLSELTAFGQVNWAWVMPYQLFLSLTDIWPCAYYTFRCYTASPNDSNATAFVNAEQSVLLRDSMRNGRFLLIDGMQVPVIIDNTIAEINHANGNFTSNMYLLPLSAPGRYGDTNGQLTYMEYFNYRGPFGMMSELGTVGPDNIYKVSADGRFIAMLMSPNSFCRQILMRTRKRIICRVPFLAARIDNLQYNVYIKERSPFIDSSFYVNGGNTSFVGPTYNSPID
jgi:hypothetical protein